MEGKSPGKRIGRIARWLLALACLGYIVHFFWTNQDQLKLLGRFDLASVVLLFGLYLVALPIEAWRYRVVLDHCSDATIGFRSWYEVFVVGRLLNQVAPQAGNVYRGVTMKRRFGLAYTEYISSFASYLWLDSVLNLLLALVIVLLFARDLVVGGLRVWPVLSGVVALVLVAPPMACLVLSRVTVRHRRLKWMYEKLHRVIRDVAESIRRPRYLATVTLPGVALFGIACAAVYVVFNAIEQPVSLPLAALFAAIMKLAILLVITPGNLGVREVAYGVLADQAGVGMGAGIIVSVSVRVIATLVVIANAAIVKLAGMRRKAPPG